MKDAIIKTSKGDMKVEFFEKDAPKTVENFTKLASSGYYDNLTWHRVIPNFVIQGGCPKGDGSGGPGNDSGGPGGWFCKDIIAISKVALWEITP